MSRLHQLFNRISKAVSASLSSKVTDKLPPSSPTEQKQRNPDSQEQASFEKPEAPMELLTPAKPEQILSGRCGENMTWELQADTLRITGTGTLCRTEELKSIQDQIKHLVIEEGCTAIDKGTFSFCKCLKSVKIPDTVTEIRKNAFRCCYSLTDIKLPSGLKVIGERAFDGCTALATLTIPESVEDIGKNAFGDIPCTLYHNEPYRFLFPYRQPWMALQLFCSNGFQYVCGCNDNLFGTYIEPSGGFIDGDKPKISYPEGAVITGYMGCDTEVVIPAELDGNPVVGIARDAFAKNTQLSRISIADGIVRIGVSAFLKCRNLESVRFPENLEMIDSYAFRDTRLTELTLPAKLRKIGQLAFSGTHITEAILPDKLEILGDDSFFKCPKLRKVYIPANIKCFVDAQAEDGWPMDLIYEQYGPASDAHGEPMSDSGSINTFAECPMLTEVEDHYGLNEWQKDMMFESTPWLEEQKKF